ncbi:MAG: hypothetical protein VKL39_00505, partial [Leptolyngbyaceae bacterium]|nr:hypothetical protein [Leptolyngbyaceae bacterium]
MTISSSTTVSTSNVGLASIIHVPQPHIPQGTPPQPHKRRSAQPASPQNHPSRHSQPQHSQLRTEASVDAGENLTPATVDIRDEMVERFRRYYQRFVGYPATDFQLPANTSVRYSLLQHTGIHFWDTPTFKASVAGFGGVMTTLSVGFLLSDHAPNLLKADPLSYTLPNTSTSRSVSVGGAREQVDPIALDTHHLTLSDRPETIPNLEFSQTAPALENIESLMSEIEMVPIEDLPVISLDSLSERRFDVQPQADAPTQAPAQRLESSDAEAVAAELPNASPRAIAPVPLQPPAIA